MKIRGLITEDFVNYNKACMVVEFPYCTFKCGNCLCQNASLVDEPLIEIGAEQLLTNYYLNNSITKAICCQGLEPLDSFSDVLDLLFLLRKEFKCNDDFVIYTGYTEEEVAARGQLAELQKYSNVIVKFGRYVPNQDSHFDKVLQVNLASDNQYAKKIS